MNKKLTILISSISILNFSLIFNLNKNTLNPRDLNVFIELKDFGSNDEVSKKLVKEEFKRELQSIVGLNYRKINEYSLISNMVNLEISSRDYEEIKNLKIVKNSFKNHTYNCTFEGESTEKEVIKPDKDYSRIEMNIPDYSKDGENTLICIIDDSFKIDHEMFKTLESSYKYSKSEINSIKSKSGFNAKDAGYYNNKIPFYYSYATNSLEMTYKNNKDFHGSHVAGIAGANNTFYGAAKNAQLALMRVTRNNALHSFSDDAIINALEDAAKLNCDVINMSFGISLVDNGLSDNYKNIFDNLYKLGIEVNLACGNDGKDSFETGVGEYSSLDSIEQGEIGRLASYPTVTSVGATNLKSDDKIGTSFSTISNKIFFARDQIIKENGQEDNYLIKNYIKNNPFSNLIPENKDFQELDYVLIPGYGSEEDYKNVDVKNKIAVVKRGGPKDDLEVNSNKYLFITKIHNAYQNGAIGIIICNTNESSGSLGNTIINFDPGSAPALKKEEYIPTALTSTYTYKLLKNETNKKIRISRKNDANYSSDGGQTDLSLTPDIAAPGTNIYSGISNDKNENKYKYLSGTSMASPNFSGAVANILSNYSGEDINQYKRTIMARIMSNSTLLKDSNNSFLSPRKVGAGLANVKKVIESDAYLAYGEFNKAKIELKNNEDIKNGKLKFDVKTYNEANFDKNYKATLYVEIPETIIPDEQLDLLKNKELKTTRNVLINTFTSDVTLKKGVSTISFNYSLSEENKRLLEKFENGVQIEGYLVLDSKSDEKDLSIPFFGFYGDFNSLDAIEPFLFERDENKIYESDVVNQLLDIYPATPTLYKGSDFRSIFAISDKALTSAQKTSIETSKKNILDYYQEVIYDKRNNSINLGLKGVSSHIYIQQFISRMIKDHKVTLKNLATNEVVLNTYLKNTTYTIYNYASSSSVHPLIRSTYNKSSLNSGKILNLATLELSLVDSSNNLIYEEGEYQLIFSYTLDNGVIKNKTYNIRLYKELKKIDPSIIYNKVVIFDKKKYLEVVFKSEDVKNLLLNNKNYDYELVENYYAKVLIKLEKLEESTSYNLSLIDIYDQSISLLFSKRGENLLVFEQNDLNSGDKVWFNNTEENKENTTSIIYEFNVVSSGNVEILLNQTSTISLNLDMSKINNLTTIKVYEEKDGNFIPIDFDLKAETLTLKATSKKIKIQYERKNQEQPKDEKEINIYLAIYVPLILASLLTSVLTFILVRKIHKK